MLRRSTYGLLASGGVLFLAGAAGLTAVWSLVAGTLILTTASLVLAVVLEQRDLPPWPPAGLPFELREGPSEVARLDTVA